MAGKQTISTRLGIAERLRLARVRGDESQEQFAKRTGVAQTHISRYERGAQMPRLDQVERIARAAGVDVDWILTGRDATAPHVSVSAQLLDRQLTGVAREAIERLLGTFRRLTPTKQEIYLGLIKCLEDLLVEEKDAIRTRKSS